MKNLLIILNPFLRILQKTKRQKGINRASVLVALVKLAVLKRLHKTTKEVTVKMGKYVLTSPDYNTLSFLIKEKFVDEQYFFKERSVKPVIFDCGSSIGISVLYFKCLHPGSEIYSFEPNPTAFSFLERNINRNRFNNVHAYNLALSSKKGAIDFFVSGENPFLNSKTSISHSSNYKQIKVPTKTLSQFLLAFPEVHLVKIDVEGSELELLDDLTKDVLKRKLVKKFIIEYHTSIHHDIAVLNTFISGFTKHGYSYSFLRGKQNEMHVDKLILFYL
jgi:FkbM family methyltransferase